jgi:Ig-like domain CHU_C associated
MKSLIHSLILFQIPKIDILMKTNFTKPIFSIISILCLLFSSYTDVQGQLFWLTSLLGNTGQDPVLNYNVNNTGGQMGISYISTGRGVIFNDADINNASSYIAQAFATVPVANRYKATAGVPVTLQISISMYNTTNDPLYNTSPYHSGITNYLTLVGAQGKNEQANLYDQNINITNTGFQQVNTFNLRVNSYSYSTTFTFAVGRTQSWIVFKIPEYNYLTGVTHNNLVVLPFVVEGNMQTQVDSLGVTSEPKVPYMVIHKPPGDGSFSQINTTSKTCRNFDESYSKDATNTTKASLKIGAKGSIGFIATIDYEFYAQFSGELATSNMNAYRSSNQTCLEVTNTWATSDIPAASRNGSDVFLGYATDFAYGVGRKVSILPNSVIKVDTSLYFRPIEPVRQFVLTKDGILADIASQQILMNNVSLSNKLRAEAQYQIAVWNQVLFKNDSTIAAANTPIGIPISFSAGADGSSSSTLEYSATNNIEVGHYIEGAAAIEAVVNIGGSGFSAGHEFRTKKSFGSAIGGGTTTTNSISYTFKDNDAGDIFYVNKYKDPIYGTPIFKTFTGTRSSCPYEGGYQRDQPALQIVGSAQNIITIPNITLGTPATFQVKLCNNNSTEVRSYKLGFVSQTNSSDLLITAAGSTGSDFGTFSVNPNTCRVENYDVNISRRYPTSDVNFSNLEFQLYPACDPDIKASLFANVSFSAPPSPANVAASTNTACTGTPVILTASCAVTTTPTWYTQAVGGFPVAVGSSVTVNPSVNTTYYVGCETVNYVRDRVATKLVLVGTPSTVLNLTTNYTTGSTLQIATNTITATNKVISPAYAVYKAGKSISFGPGFEARSGSLFAAQIGGCN